MLKLLAIPFAVVVAQAASAQATAVTADPLAGGSSQPGVDSSKYPQVAASGGEAVLVWEDYRGASWQIFTRRSSSSGSAWPGADVALPRHTSGSDARYPSIAASGANVMVGWAEHLPSGLEQIVVVASVDNGATWGATTAVSTLSPISSVLVSEPAISVAGDGTLYVAWSQQEVSRDSGSGELDIIDRGYLSWSTDAGQTWNTPRVVEATSPVERLQAVDEVVVSGLDSGNAVVAFKSNELTVSQQSVRFEPFATRFVKSSANLDAATLLQAPGGPLTGSVAFLSIDTQGQRGVAVAFASSDLVAKSQTVYALYSSSGGATWPDVQPVSSVEQSVGVLASSTRPSLAMTSGLVHVAHYAGIVVGDFGYLFSNVYVSTLDTSVSATDWSDSVHLPGPQVGANTLSRLPKIAIAASGQRAIVAWTQYRGNVNQDEYDLVWDDIRFATTSDGGAAWTVAPQALSAASTGLGGSSHPQVQFKGVQGVVCWDNRGRGDGAPEVFASIVSGF
ncbi:sialidase family protein [Engelhardtia mirabilis]|uniref:BNR/Asp-box repeat protein n=1 Tax=Engelhardtia mirabilis TaxID=2528011 RepID=A0A518BPF9_9BACT|nr:hypothetical protein Pla133_39700 [Planctomycetes bacterium Pla133]QDV03187.1 hypothetical protein Pla86_39690 [Planctomycetes bacterium Pla86]